MNRISTILTLLLALVSPAGAQEFSVSDDVFARYRSNQSEMHIAFTKEVFRVLEGKPAALSANELRKLENPVVAVGSEGIEVLWIQDALGEVGFGNAKPDGKFGAQTAANVRRFQRLHDLTADGQVGAETWTALGLPKERKPAWKENPIPRETAKGLVVRYNVSDSVAVESTEKKGVAKSWQKIPFQEIARFDIAQWPEFMVHLVEVGDLARYEEIEGRLLLSFRSDTKPVQPLGDNAIQLSTETQSLIRLAPQYPPRRTSSGRAVIFIHEPHSDITGHLQLVPGLDALLRENPNKEFKFLVEGGLPENKGTIENPTRDISTTEVEAILAQDPAARSEQVFYLLRNFLIDSPLTYRLLYRPVPALAIDDPVALARDPGRGEIYPKGLHRELAQILKQLQTEGERARPAVAPFFALNKAYEPEALLATRMDGASHVTWLGATNDKYHALAKSLAAVSADKYATNIQFLKNAAKGLDLERRSFAAALERDECMAKFTRDHFTGPDAARIPVVFIGSFHTQGIIDRLGPDIGYVVLEPRFRGDSQRQEQQFNETLVDYIRTVDRVARDTHKADVLPPQKAFPKLSSISKKIAEKHTSRFVLDDAPFDKATIDAIRDSIGQNGTFNTARVELAAPGGAGGATPPPPRDAGAAFAAFSQGPHGSFGKLLLMRDHLDGWKQQPRLNYMKNVLLAPPDGRRASGKGVSLAFYTDPATHQVFASRYDAVTKSYYLFEGKDALLAMEAWRARKAREAHLMLSDLLRRVSHSIS